MIVESQSRTWHRDPLTCRAQLQRASLSDVRKDYVTVLAKAFVYVSCCCCCLVLRTMPQAISEVILRGMFVVTQSRLNVNMDHFVNRWEPWPLFSLFLYIYFNFSCQLFFILINGPFHHGSFIFFFIESTKNVNHDKYHYGEMKWSTSGYDMYRPVLCWQMVNVAEIIS